jgi:hypothetical protein
MFPAAVFWVALFFPKRRMAHNEDQKDWYEAERLIEEASVPFVR